MGHGNLVSEAISLYRVSTVMGEGCHGAHAPFSTLLVSDGKLWYPLANYASMMQVDPWKYEAAVGEDLEGGTLPQTNCTRIGSVEIKAQEKLFVSTHCQLQLNLGSYAVAPFSYGE